MHPLLTKHGLIARGPQGQKIDRAELITFLSAPVLPSKALRRYTVAAVALEDLACDLQVHLFDNLEAAEGFYHGVLWEDRDDRDTVIEYLPRSDAREIVAIVLVVYRESDDHGLTVFDRRKVRHVHQWSDSPVVRA